MRHNRPLIEGGRYWFPLSAYEYVVMHTGKEDIPYLLCPPHDCVYPEAPKLAVDADGYMHSNEGQLTTHSSELNYGGAIYDWKTKQTTPTPTPRDTGDASDT